jgi:AcrR family transcriptional regulator
VDSHERLDPRIRRTRQMLFEALERLLKSRSIDQLSVSDITDAATLNRATFYDHYTDKFALLEGLVEARFQELMSHRGVVFDGGCTQAILGIISTTCDYLAAIPGVDCPERRQMEKHFEAAIIDVVRGMILSGLQHHPPPNPIAPELIAAVVSGPPSRAGSRRLHLYLGESHPGSTAKHGNAAKWPLENIPKKLDSVGETSAIIEMLWPLLPRANADEDYIAVYIAPPQ